MSSSLESESLRHSPARVAELREALKDCADDLEERISAQYGDAPDRYPDAKGKYARDMEPVRRARDLLAATGKGGE